MTLNAELKLDIYVIYIICGYFEKFLFFQFFRMMLLEIPAVIITSRIRLGLENDFFFNYFLNYNFVLLGLSFLLKSLEIYFWWSIPWEVWRAVVAIVVVSSTDIFVVQLIIFAKPCIKVELKQLVFIFMTKNFMLKNVLHMFYFPLL